MKTQIEKVGASNAAFSSRVNQRRSDHLDCMMRTVPDEVPVKKCTLLGKYAMEVTAASCWL